MIYFFDIFPIVINITTNAIYFISGDSYETLEMVNEFNRFTLFGIFFCCIVNFFTRDRKLSEGERKELNKKMYGMKLLNIDFIGYINWYMFKRRIKICDIFSDTEKNWGKFYNKPSYEDISLLWRIKPIIAPHVSVSFNERIKHIDLIALIFILLLFTGFNLVALPMMIIIFMFTILDVLYFIDDIL